MIDIIIAGWPTGWLAGRLAVSGAARQVARISLGDAPSRARLQIVENFLVAAAKKCARRPTAADQKRS